MQLEVANLDDLATVAFVDFNSILVQLEGQGVAEPGAHRPHFNSILVQLEVGNQALKHRHAGLFQFHIGAIRRLYEITKDTRGDLFQFHIGAIRSKQDYISRPWFSIISIPYWCN